MSPNQNSTHSPSWPPWLFYLKQLVGFRLLGVLRPQRPLEIQPLLEIGDDRVLDREVVDRFPRERDLLVPFLNSFDITWAKRRRGYNTELSVYFLLPEKFIQEQFGLDREVMLVVSVYPDLQPPRCRLL